MPALLDLNDFCLPHLLSVNCTKNIIKAGMCDNKIKQDQNRNAAQKSLLSQNVYPLPSLMQSPAPHHQMFYSRRANNFSSPMK